MVNFILRRMLAAVLLVLGAATLIFFMMRLVPGDPVRIALADMDVTPEQIEARRAALGLDRPLAEQYVTWLGRVVQGNLGISLLSGRSVSADILERLPRTLELVGTSIVVALVIGLPLGVLTATRRDTMVDYVGSSLALLGLSTPNFVTGTLLVLFLALKLRWVAASGYVAPAEDPLQHLKLLILPSLTLGIAISGVIMRMTRGALLEVLAQDYIRTAFGKGLSQRVVYNQHALRNALIPVVTITGVQMGTMLGGTVIAEFIFNWPGLSSLLISSVSQRDYPVIQGIVLVITVSVALITLAVDLINGLLDPRIRLQ